MQTGGVRKRLRIEEKLLRNTFAILFIPSVSHQPRQEYLRSLVGGRKWLLQGVTIHSRMPAALEFLDVPVCNVLGARIGLRQE